ncbi:hypothetical protein LWI29_023559 [Acer saccharum]|uniref:Integrase catalytic domain-containing protein n=1 Tax=Acer saccharum TaxID=4024 RepID=A0AA39RL55_ACESA|nr:hypothetical protein LWI29_023559 [Acer saccharum]
MSSEQQNSNNNWILDTGASHHMTSDLQNLSLHSEYGGTEDIMDLTTGAFLVRGQNKGNLYVWPTSTQPSPLPSKFRQNFMSSRPVISPLSWHCRLGHPSLPVLQNLISTRNLPIPKSATSFSYCPACLCNKSHKLPFGTSTLVSNKPLEIIFTDVWGPAHVPSFDNFKYYVIFVDYFSKYTWLYPLKHKSDVPQVFRRFRLLVENFFNTRIKTVYSDGSGEAHSLGLDLQNLGIQHLKSPPHTPEHVGTAERKHRHVVETALTLLNHASLPPKFWSLAFQAAVYLINRMPTKVLHHQSPYSKIFNKDPNYHKLRVFGCLCFPWLRPYTSHKLQPRSKPCVFVGYSNEHNSYLCLDRSTNRVYISRHVVFVETEFPFASVKQSTSTLSPLTVTQWIDSMPSVPTNHPDIDSDTTLESLPLHLSSQPDVIPVYPSPPPSPPSPLDGCHLVSSAGPSQPVVPSSSPFASSLPTAPLLRATQAAVPLSTAPY